MYLELLLEMWNKVLKLNCDDQFKLPPIISPTIQLKIHCPKKQESKKNQIQREIM